MVAAFIFALKGPLNKSAAFKKIAALCSQGVDSQECLAFSAEFIAFSTWLLFPL